jgi:hypothetical protein
MGYIVRIVKCVNLFREGTNMLITTSRKQFDQSIALFYNFFMKPLRREFRKQEQ